VVTVFFQYLREQPDFARFIPQVLMSGRAVPRPVHQVMEANHRLIADLIAQGQRNGIIRRGDPRLMALSIGAQPVFLTLMQSALRQAMAIDQKDPATRERVVESVKQFVRAGLSAGGARRRGGTTAGKRRAM
jgi:hypothetical protein